MDGTQNSPQTEPAASTKTKWTRFRTNAAMADEIRLCAAPLGMTPPEWVRHVIANQLERERELRSAAAKFGVLPTRTPGATLERGDGR